ncbi:MAG: hypothetical protein J6B55_01435 [Clostridia bacterium]|nr:hypothetical protein [Clostridia bacterium]
MDLLRKIWPTPFKIEKGNIVSFLIQLIIFLVITAIAGAVVGVLASIKIIGFDFIFGTIGSLMGIYGFVGIVLCILKFLGIV